MGGSLRGIPCPQSVKAVVHCLAKRTPAYSWETAPAHDPAGPTTHTGEERQPRCTAHEGRGEKREKEKETHEMNKRQDGLVDKNTWKSNAKQPTDESNRQKQTMKKYGLTTTRNRAGTVAATPPPPPPPWA